MKQRFLVFVFFILVSLIVSCTFTTPIKDLPKKTLPLPQKLRITNKSTYKISSLKVRFPDELVAFGDVLPGETTNYQVVIRGVYRYAAYDVEVDGKEYQQPVIDWVGESPMQGSSFTYIFEVDPTRWQTEGQVIKLVDVRVDQMTVSELTSQPTLHFTLPPFAPKPTTTPLNISTTALIPTSTLPRNPNPKIIPTPIQGDVYVLLLPQKPPFLLALARIPAACLLEPQGCPPIGIVHQDFNPKPPVLRQTELVFSPDGKSIWWNNDFQQNIFALDTERLAIRPVAQNILAIRGDFQWSPDGQWVAVAVQGKGPYDGQVLLIDSKSGKQHILLNTLNDLKFPVGWKNNHELFVMIHQYGPPAGNPNEKWVVNRQWLALLDITTGQAPETLKEFLNLSPISLSPNREWLAFYQNINGKLDLSLQSLIEGKVVDLKTQREFLGWSPDSQWIALRDSNGDVFILHPDGSAEQKIASLSSEYSVRWFVDNQHLFVTRRMSGADGLDRVSISLVSIDDGTIHPVELKGLNTKDFLPDSFFWAQ